MKYLATTVRGLPPNITKGEIRDYFGSSPDLANCVVGPIAKDIQNNGCSATVILQAKKHGRSLQDIKDSFHGSALYGGNTTRISVGDNFLGLTALSGDVHAPIQ